MAPSKPSSKSSKKRKVMEVDPSQHRLDRFLAPSSSSPLKQQFQQQMDDPMQLDSSTNAAFEHSQRSVEQQQIQQPNQEATVNVSSLLGTFRPQSLIPSITIASANPARPKQLSDSFLKSSWETQKSLVIGILSGSTSLSINYITVSKLSSNMCRYGKAEEIYHELKKELEHHVKNMEKELSSVPINQGLLSRLQLSWDMFCKRLTTIRNVFMELDRCYILTNTQFSSVIQLGKHIFSETIMHNEHFRVTVTSEILKLIKLDRDGQQVDLSLIQSILHMMMELAYYISDFEPRFLVSTENYYKDESDRLIKTMSIPEYIQHASKRKDEESNDRINNYLDQHTTQPLTNIVVSQLVYNKTELIIKRGFDDMMKKNMTEHLKILYKLLSKNPKSNLLRTAFGEYIKTQGVALISNPLSDPTMVASLLKFKHKLDTILRTCFDSDPLFMNTLKESFEYFINTRGNKPAEMLAKFMDSNLKLSQKKSKVGSSITNDTEILGSTLVLFRYIRSKDAFEAYYKRFLAKRLLLDRSGSIDLENRVLETLKLECGHEFTKNLEGMFNDIQISSDLNVTFKKDYTKQKTPLIVKVIQQTTWPTYAISKIILPPNMSKAQDNFTEFYTKKFDGRKLVWQNSLSSCSIMAYFPKGVKELITSLCQAVVLILFNKKKTLTFQEIMTKTSLGKGELASILASLSTDSIQLLTVSESRGSSRSITTLDRFTYNDQFESESVRIRVPAAQADQAVEEQKEVEAKVTVNRQHQLEAAIVRIMKANKTLSHSALVNELFTQLKYPIETDDIKKRIESLIEKDYMIRDTEDSNMYIYQS